MAGGGVCGHPERAHHGDRAGLYRAIREAFAVLEEEAAAGRLAGYGVATWDGFDEAFTVPLGVSARRAYTGRSADSALPAGPCDSTEVAPSEHR